MFPQQGWRNTSGGGSGGTNLTIQNTLWVMKNGDDSTALPNRLDKPFLTITGANEQASANDTIYVVSGYYEEKSSVFLSDIYYVLEDGVTVQSRGVIISDNGDTAFINISGNGILATLEQAVSITNVDSVLNLQCDKIISEGAGISCTGNFNIDVNIISVALNAISLFGDVVFGHIKVNKIQTYADDFVIVISDCNTDGQLRNMYLYINEINCAVTSLPCMTLSNNSETRIYFECKTFNQTEVSNILSCDRSYLYVNNSNFLGIGEGIYLSDESVVLFTNSNVTTDGTAISTDQLSARLYAQFNNCTLKTTADSTAIIITQQAEIYLSNCVIVSGDGRRNAVISLFGSATILRLRNCQIISNSSEVLYSISSSEPSNIYVYGQCSSNRPTNSDLTNQVAGTNIIVDADINQNSNNFY